MKLWTKLLLAVLGFILLAAVLGKNNLLNDKDLKLGILSPKGVSMLSISYQRRMINQLTVPEDNVVWVPYGMGWYRSDKILKLLEQEKKINLADEVFFYNYGFVPDLVLTLDNPDSWDNNLSLIGRWGWSNWLRFKWQENQMRFKEENSNSLELNEILARDFSDSEIAKGDLKVSIYNASDNMGLASFIAKVLEWSGMVVIGVENYPTKNEDCWITVAKGESSLTEINYLKNRFKTCPLRESESVANGNVEIYFGEKFAQMLNYQSYKINNQ